MADVIEVKGKFLFEIWDKIRGLKTNVSEINASIEEAKQDVREIELISSPFPF